MLEDPKTAGRNIRCYISGPIGGNVENIRFSLMKRNVQMLTPSGLSTGREFCETIQEMISKADLVIGILRSQRESQAVLFELGMAAAMNRRIVVFAPPKGGYVPFALQSFIILRTDLRNRSEIQFAIDQILLAPFSRKRTSGDYVTKQRTQRPSIRSRRLELQNIMEVGDAKKFEEIITAAIRDSGVEAAVTRTFQHRQMDLAVWADEFQFVLGNPLLIEFKLRLASEEQVRAALKHCAVATDKSGGQWSLLIYGTGPKVFRKHWLSIGPTVLIISASDLFERMQDQSFMEIVVGLRNLRTHGGEH